MNNVSEKNIKRSVIGILISLLLASLIVFAGSHHGIKVYGLPLFLIGVMIAFAINWFMFVPQYLAQSEKYYDLTGSVTYLSVTFTALLLAARYDVRSVIVAAIVAIWAVRLGSFLFLRIKKVGKDRRFDVIKPDAPRYFMTWTLQALWVTVTLGPALVILTTSQPVEPDLLLILGGLMWLAGFLIEVIADRQKTVHRSIPENQDRFISSGLWAWSRHPNYFGEMLLWLGVAVIAFPVMNGAQYITLISPLFVYLLIAKVSGIPLLEEHAESKWGDDPEYQEYKKNTSLLILRPPKNDK